MVNDLMTTFGATSTMLGVLISFYYYAYTILQLPCGVILDRIGARNLMGLSALLCVFGSVLFAGFDRIYVAQIGRFLVGAGSACAFISCLQVASSLFPKKYFVILAGVTNMMGTLGGLFGGPPVAKAVNIIGWQKTTYWLAGIGVLITLLIFFFIPKDIKKKRTEKSFRSVLNAILKLLKNSQVILPGVVGSFMYLPISAFSELWAVPFFMSRYGINNEQASLASAMVFIGVAIGSILLAIFARRIRSYVKTMQISTIFTSLLFVLLLFVQCNVYVAFGIVFLIGFLTGAQTISFTCAKNSVTSEFSGTALALTNCIIMLVGAIFQPLLGVLLDFFWNGKVKESGVRIYDIDCYNHALLVIPVCLMLAYLLSVFVKETIHSESE
jgi:predicted MFS family arabinose efflux permease